MLVGCVDRHLGDDRGILAMDETGFLIRCTPAAGVARRCSGTAARMENSRVGVFLTYAGRGGRTVLDREPYLPTVWMDDPARCARVGIRPERALATTLEPAGDMIERETSSMVSRQVCATDFRAGACTTSWWCR